MKVTRHFTREELWPFWEEVDEPFPLMTVTVDIDEDLMIRYNQAAQVFWRLHRQIEEICEEADK